MNNNYVCNNNNNNNSYVDVDDKNYDSFKNNKESVAISGIIGKSYSNNFMNNAKAECLRYRRRGEYRLTF